MLREPLMQDAGLTTVDMNAFFAYLYGQHQIRSVFLLRVFLSFHVTTFVQ